MNVDATTNETERQLRAICAEEIMRALADAAGIRADLPVHRWVARVSEEIAADIVRNFHLTAKEDRREGQPNSKS